MNDSRDGYHDFIEDLRENEIKFKPIHSTSNHFYKPYQLHNKFVYGGVDDIYMLKKDFCGTGNGNPLDSKHYGDFGVLLPEKFATYESNHTGEPDTTGSMLDNTEKMDTDDTSEISENFTDYLASYAEDDLDYGPWSQTYTESDSCAISEFSILFHVLLILILVVVVVGIRKPQRKIFLF